MIKRFLYRKNEFHGAKKKMFLKKKPMGQKNARKIIHPINFVDIFICGEIVSTENWLTV